MVLAKLKADAESKLGETITEAVITVPVHLFLFMLFTPFFFFLLFFFFRQFAVLAADEALGGKHGVFRVGYRLTFGGLQMCIRDSYYRRPLPHARFKT